jgi:hypothetical protein
LFNKRKSKTMDVNGKPVVESAFERRKSMAQKFEVEQAERPRFKTVDDVDDVNNKTRPVKEDDDVPPPPDDDDDAPPPPPPPPAAAAAKAAPAAAAARSKTPPLPPPSTASPSKHKNSPLATTKKAPAPSKEPSPPASPGGGRKADADYIEFTVVPLLLRSGVSYDEANKYGELLKSRSEADVARIMSSSMLLLEDIEKKKVKIPGSFEKSLLNDQFWVKGKTAAGNRKSFVYYSPVAADAARPASHDGGSSSTDKSPLAKVRAESATRQRASFSGGQVPIIAEEGDASRYKAPTRRAQAESVSKDLQDLVQELSKLDSPNM